MPDSKISPWAVEPEDQIVSLKMLSNFCCLSPSRKKNFKSKRKSKVKNHESKTKTSASSTHTTFKALNTNKVQLKHATTQIKFNYIEREKTRTPTRNSIVKRLGVRSAQNLHHIDGTRQNSFSQLSIGRKTTLSSKRGTKLLDENHEKNKTSLAIQRKIYMLKKGLPNCQKPMQNKFSNMIQKIWKPN